MVAAPMPLAREDRAVLALEGPTVAGHTCKVVLVGAGAPSVDALRTSIARRIAAAPLLTRRLGDSADAPAWVPDEAFDVRRHIREIAVEAPLDDAGLCTAVARRFEQRLDRRHPLWQLDVVNWRDGRALIWRLHHALADGTTAMRYARALLWDREGHDERVAPLPTHPAHPAHAADDARRRAHLAGFLHREMARTRSASPFDGEIGTRRAVAFAHVPLAPLHDAARARCGATLNDAVLDVVAGALRHWLLARHAHPDELRVRVPVSLHHTDEAANRDSFFSLALSLGEPDPVARLAAVHAATRTRKDDRDAQTMDDLLGDLDRISPRLRAFADRLASSPRRFAVAVSNVPGPHGPVRVLGAPVRALHTLAEIGEHHALRVAVVSLGGSLCFGFCADPAIVEDVETMAAGVEAEAALLTAGA